jgi:hypothetical protein
MGRRSCASSLITTTSRHPRSSLRIGAFGSRVARRRIARRSREARPLGLCHRCRSRAGWRDRQVLSGCTLDQVLAQLKKTSNTASPWPLCSRSAASSSRSVCRSVVRSPSVLLAAPLAPKAEAVVEGEALFAGWHRMSIIHRCHAGDGRGSGAALLWARTVVALATPGACDRER